MSKKKSILRWAIPTAICSFMFVPLISGVLSNTEAKEVRATESGVVVWEGDYLYAEISTESLPEKNPMLFCIEFSQNDSAVICDSQGETIKEVPKSSGGETTFTNEQWASIKNDTSIQIWPQNDSNILKVSYVIAPDHTHGTGSDAIGFYNWDGGTEHNSMPSEAGSYVLTSDIELTASWAVPEGTTNLCLNGHNIIMTEKDLNVIVVDTESILNLYDCGDTSHNGYVDDNSLWHLGEGEGTAKTLTGGIITGGYYTKTSGSGGGVNVGRGEFNMYGGTIAGNKAGANGGGVFVGTDGKFTMSAGEIIFNKANAGGGAATQAGTFEINGGVVTNNTATNGGGMFIFNGTCTMKGGRISNNIATTKAGGFFDNGTLIVGGSAVITDNTETVNEIPSNVYLYGKTITLGTGNDAPTTMSVGVTTKTAPTEGAPVKITADGSADYSANLFSDNSNYKPCFNNNGTDDDTTDDYLELRDAYLITNNTKEADKATNNGYIEVIETAVKDEEVSIAVYPNQGYKLSSLIYNDGEDHYITSDLSFVMSDGDVSVFATFEEKADQVVTIVLDKEFIYPNTPGIQEAGLYVYSNYYEKHGDGVVTVEFKHKGADDSEYTTQVPTEYGEYTVRVSVAEGTDYLAGFATKDFTYSPQVITQVGFGSLEQPVAGAVAPEKTTSMLVDTKYHEIVTWDPEITTTNADGKGIFDCGTTYTAKVTLTLKDDYKDNYVFADPEHIVLKGAGTGWTLSDDSTNKTLIYTKEFAATDDHSVNKVSGTVTCTTAGYKDAYLCENCGLYFEDEACTKEIGDANAYDLWKEGDGKSSALGHHYSGEVTYTWNDETHKCTASWHCDHTGCEEVEFETVTGTYVKDTDATCETNEKGHYEATFDNSNFETQTTATNSVEKENTATGHDTTKVNGQSATCTEDGYKDAYYCNDCGMYFEDADGTTLIGNSDAYSAWKANAGHLDKLVKEAEEPAKDNTGLIVGLAVGGFLLLLLIIYLLGYFFLYRKGKLDERKTKVIYKILPRGNKNLKEDSQEQKEIK